jgi:hypothetical protein
MRLRERAKPLRLLAVAGLVCVNVFVCCASVVSDVFPNFARFSRYFQS